MLPSASVMRYQNSLINNTSLSYCETNDIYKLRSLKRISIVPYYIKNNTIYYFLCVDSDYGMLTDPGGTIENGEDPISAATRELYEESMGIFDYRSNQSIDFIKNNSTAIYNNKMAIIFQYIEVESPDDLCYIFRERYEEKLLDKNTPSTSLENSYLLWISQNDLKLLCNDKKVSLPESLKQLLLPNLSLSKELITPKLAITTKIIEDFLKGPDYYMEIWEPVKNLLKYSLNTQAIIL